MATKKKVGIKVPTKNEILKKYGSMIIQASDTKEPGLWLPSTFFNLNYTLGGGFPWGKVTEIAGEESSGKSLIALNAAYACQQLGGSVIWVDAEQSWMNSWAELNGIDPNKVTVIRDTRIEYISDAVADVAIYLLGMSEILGINLAEEIQKKVYKNEKREYKVINGVNTRVKECDKTR